MDYLDPQKSLLAWIILIAALAVLCLLLWLVNKLVRKLGVREHYVDRMGSSMLALERLIRPSAEHVLTARQTRKAVLPNRDGKPPSKSAGQ